MEGIILRRLDGRVENSWYTAGLVDYLSMTQLESGVEAYLFSTLEQQVKALEQYQADNGLWHTIIDRPDTYWRLLPAVRLPMVS